MSRITCNKILSIVVILSGSAGEYLPKRKEEGDTELSAPVVFTFVLRGG